jgi:O-antigen chain-terminating bifunctional methyltransferase/kinase
MSAIEKSVADESDESAKRVIDLVAQLPEIYQPIYGQPQIQGSRSSDPRRVSTVVDTVERIATVTGRTLRVLDLGSAQGYVSFRLAEVGHHVTGIEFLDSNVAVARLIHEEHPHLDVSFIEGDVMECQSLVDVSGFDVVLGLSVLHHALHRDGPGRVAKLVSALATSIPHGVFEMALASEPLYWAPSLPPDPRITLAPYPFVREVGHARTHLSEISRPILLASSTHALVADNLEEIESWTESPHADADVNHLGLRRYFMLESGIVKIAARFVDRTDDGVLEHYRGELRNEARVLESVAETPIDAPTLIELVDGPNETVIVRSAYPGEPLSDIASSLTDDDRVTITSQVLAALVDFETQSLYHTDLRLWNVIWDAKNRTARLIDHGALSPSPGDTMWPNDAYFSLMVWLVSLWSSHADQNGLAHPRRFRLGQAELPQSVNALIATLMTQTRDTGVFRRLAEQWNSTVSGGTVAPSAPLVWHWLEELEQRSVDAERSVHAVHEAALRDQRERELEYEYEHEQFLIDRQAWADERDHLIDERGRLIDEREHLIGELERLQLTSTFLDAELSRTRATVSWRSTSPLRAVRSTLSRTRRV